MPSELDDVRQIVGAEHVLTDDDVRAGFEVDWTGRYGGPCVAVVRPASTAEVARVLAWCNERSIEVVPQAGNTGLVGGGVPRAVGDRTRPAIVLSMRRLDMITDVDVASMQLTAGAGVTIGAWRAAARSVGLDSPIDFAARESATVGGAIATNAGGSRVVRFGTMRRRAVGVEAVLADGTVVGSLAGLPKETVGLHWPSLIAGSEGTVAVITAARLSLVPHYDAVTTVLVAIDGVDAAVNLLGSLRRRLDSLDSVEMIFPEAYGLVTSHLGMRPPLLVAPEALAVLIECADHDDPTDQLLAVIAGSPGVTGTAVATGGAPRTELLAIRDRVTEAIAAASSGVGQAPTYKLDVAVPPSSLAQVVAVARRAADSQRALLIPFGHLAEGNLHLNFLGATDTDALAATVLPVVAELGGTISAEHGVGIAKTRWLHLVRQPGDLAAQRAIRAALDPNGILNPGVL